MNDTPSPNHGATPTHFGASGARLYASAVADYELTIPETSTLLQAAETVDTLRLLEDSIRANGPITPTGRPNPLLAEARQQRAILVRFLGLLDLRLDDEDDTASPKRPSASRQAQKAARAMHDKRRGR